MEFLSRQYADVLVAAPLGRIDHAASASLEQRLVPLVADAGTRLAGVVLDFGGVVYISSVGLRVLMIASKSMRAHGKPISVAALQPVVSEIFTISRFDKVLPVFSSVRDALANVSPAAQRAFDADPESPRA
jgi:anti-sigma B factor antagonist/stage II sporulation protein AA (anti-sigma F factor antagonist)